MRRVGLFLVVMMAVASAAASDSLKVQKSELSWLRRTIRGFSYIDTNYVEPQHYNWSLMGQATYTSDIYTLRTSRGQRQSITFRSSPNLKVGPYFGWRWIFLGYTFDLKKVTFEGLSGKQELDFSIYSAQIGADVFYRRTGSDYHISNVDLGDGIDARKLEGLPFSDVSVGITGFNLYYIFNHQRFSYPAAFAQSTIQKISCGSWMAGFGYAGNSITFNYERLQQLIDEQEGEQTVDLDSALMFNSVKYYDYSLSVGYAYNWVFARNCLFCASLSAALAYKKARGETDSQRAFGFNFNNLNLDGIGRFGVVYNNMRWYVGASAIIHSYNYRKSRFAANNTFGSMNLYVGYNFGPRGGYKKKRKS